MGLIDADVLKEMGATCFARRNENGELEAIISIDNAPTISIDWGIDNGDRTAYARPTGEWIRTALYGQTCYECDNCKLHYDCISNYCPNCGSKMKGAEE